MIDSELFTLYSVVCLITEDSRGICCSDLVQNLYPLRSEVFRYMYIRDIVEK